MFNVLTRGVGPDMRPWATPPPLPSPSLGCGEEREELCQVSVGHSGAPPISCPTPLTGEKVAESP